MSKKVLLVVTLLVLAAFALTACAGEAGPAGPEGPQGPQGEQGEPGPAAEVADLACTECHNDTAVISGKKAAWETSVHGAGTSAAYAGGRDGCAACHSGASFSKMVAEGATPATWEGDFSDVTHQDCRTCHQVHVTYTGEDWALETTAAVGLYAFEDVTFDGGSGNLCANCHQPRRGFEVVDGVVDVSSTHWGPHHGPQSAMLLGVGGAGLEGSPSGHYSLVENTCVACHVGENDNHAFTPSVASCTGCHADVENFDVNGAQTEVDALLTELGELLEAKGLYNLEEGHPVVGKYTEAEGAALWNYIYIAVEDASHGAHNMAYTKALLEASIAGISE